MFKNIHKQGTAAQQRTDQLGLAELLPQQGLVLACLRQLLLQPLAIVAT